MSPFAGEGANLAMYDGSELGRLIARNPDNTEAAVAAYENELHIRSERFARQTAENLKRFFDESAPQSTVDLFREHLK
jgi:2-polyprenyl-6-methoxyphenol hydroxylase-like FAD-dependent oxidoreductase